MEKLTDNPNFKDVSDQIFDRLTVISLVGFDKGGAKWNCLCECGRETIARVGPLLTGRKRSCGCLIQEASETCRVPDLVGNQYGNYKVLRRSPLSEKKLKRKGRWVGCWECECSCGSIKYLTTEDFKKSRGCRKCYHEKLRKQKGEDNRNYNPNLTEEDRIRTRAMYSAEVEEWRNFIFERDNYICQITGEKGGRLRAHHLESWHSNKELRFEPSNGIAILESVHKFFHTIFGCKFNTKEQFEEFKIYLDGEPELVYYLKNKTYAKKSKTNCSDSGNLA